jgi:hypothetical protein
MSVVGSHLAVDITIGGDRHKQGVHGPGAAVAGEAPLVVDVVLNGHLFGLEDRTAAPAVGDKKNSALLKFSARISFSVLTYQASL